MPYRRDGTSNGNYDIHFLAYKLRGDFSVALGTSFRPLILDRNSSPVNPAELAQARNERSDPWSKYMTAPDPLPKYQKSPCREGAVHT